MRRQKLVWSGIPLGTLVLACLFASVAKGQTLSEATDPTDEIPGHLDIRRAWVEKLSATSARFCMELREPIPAQPANYTAYIWFLDTDQNAATGQVFSDIGPDRNIRVASGGEPWTGYVDYITESDSTGGLPVYIDGNRMSLTLPVTEKGDLRYVVDPDGVFDWAAAAFETVGDIAPDSGHCTVDMPASPTLLFEDFADGAPDGFTVASGTWAIQDGGYVQSTADPPGPYRCWVDIGDVTSYALEVDLTPLSGQEARVIYARADTSEDYRVDLWGDGSRLCIPAWGQAWETRSFTVEGLSLSYNQTYRVRVAANLSGVKVWLDEVLLHDRSWADDACLADGVIGFGTFDSTAAFDNLHVYRIEPGPRPFSFVDLRLTEEGSLFLDWSDLGLNNAYTVECRDSLTEGSWIPVQPAGQWPTAATNWIDSTLSSRGVRFYRIKSEVVVPVPPPPENVTAMVSDGDVEVRWGPVTGAVSYNLYWSTNENFSKLDANKIEGITSPFIHGELSYDATYYYMVTAVGSEGESEVSSVVRATPRSTLDPTVATNMFGASKFLYTGDNPVQTGLATDAIEPRRVAVLRGKAATRDDNPLPGVQVTVLNHPEFGQTLTQGDGFFDMAVSGGSFLTVNYEKVGYLPAQRQVNVPWHDYALLPDVVLIQQDTRVSTIDLSQPHGIQVARGSVQTDDDGSRQATLLFTQGTQAELVMPDGITQPITTLNVRATEYTVGPAGPMAMPAELPPTVYYTYCVGLNADEALAAGAKDIRFTQPVYFYVENFRGFPVGIQVPSGYYDTAKGAWIPEPDGRVVKILSIAGDQAELDTNGDDVADDAAMLEAIGVTDAERGQLASLYSPGQTLWRVPLSHFTLRDLNWPPFPEGDAQPPKQQSPVSTAASRIEKPSTDSSYGTIEFQNQVFRESVPVIGTPFSLHYASSRVPGHRASRSLDISLSGDTVPSSLRRIDLEVKVAGRRFTESFPAMPNQRHTFSWDGKDAYGRQMQGVCLATTRIGYAFPIAYAFPIEVARSFGLTSAVPIPGGVRVPGESILWQEHQSGISLMDSRSYGIGGWTLSVYHVYDPAGRVLYLGDGKNRRAENMNQAIGTVAGNGKWTDVPTDPCGDGGPATEAVLGGVTGVTVGADGTLHIADGNNRIRRVGPDGIITTVAGTGVPGHGADGLPATQADISPRHIAIGPDGSIYFTDTAWASVQRVSPDGILTIVAGIGGSSGYSGDGGPATQALLGQPTGLAVCPDGSVYISDGGLSYGNNRVRRVGPDGTIQTIAGNGSEEYTGDGGPATQAGMRPYGIAVSADGSLYIVDSANQRIRKVGPDGIIHTVAGKGIGPSYNVDGIPAVDEFIIPYDVETGPDGSFYVVCYSHHRIRRVGSDGIIMTVAGSGPIGLYGGGFSGDGGPATQAMMKEPLAMAFGPDGSYYIADGLNMRVRRVGLAFPGFSGNDIAIASQDGSLIYQFNRDGRHLRTINALTGASVFAFGYDAENRLMAVTDGDGNVTTIERDSHGNPAAILSPYGQRTTLTLNPGGFLAAVTGPGGLSNSFDYTDDGLLTGVTTPRGDNFTFAYDPAGRIVGAQTPENHSLTLERADTASGHQVTVTTALGRISTYRVERLSTGAQRRVQVYPDNTRTDTLIGTDGARTTTLPDGTVLTEVDGPDPRFGMQAPIPKSVTTATPSGLTTSLTGGRTAVLSDPHDFLSLTTLTDTVTLGGKTTTKVFEAATRTFTTTGPGGRITSGAVDARGRTVRVERSGFEALHFAYDARGRQQSRAMGTGGEARIFTLDYNDVGQIDSITDPLSRVTRFVYDASWQLTSHVFPDGRVGQFEHDADGFVTAITPPGRLPHRFAYTADNAMKTYAPPQVGGSDACTQYAYDEDGQPTLITRPDGQTMEFGYEASGRLETITLPEGVLHFEYDPVKGDLTRITSPDGGTVSFTYDGFLPIGETWAGTVAGRVERTFNEELRIASESVNGGHPIAYAYEDEGLLTQSGSLVLNWHSQSPVLLGTVLGKVADSWAYNAFAEPESYSASFNGSTVYAYGLAYDKLGRIVQKTETVQGVTTTFAYGYDLAGHLTEVRKNGDVLASYSYDANGNRASRTGGTGTVSGDYDAQDRLLRYGPAEYTHAPNGELLTKTANAQTTTYAYDIEGNLRTVILPDGKRVDYLIDGRNRRIGKKVNGILTQGFLYQTPVNVVAELNASNAVVSRFVYGSRGNVPDYMVKAGSTYRILSDHLGSARLVVDVADGTIRQRMDYDEFGNVMLDTSPGFQPFGFAGGLYDPDTGLVRFGARDYDPPIGGWTAKDPVRFAGGDLNLYAYVFNNPVNLVDPEGLSGRYLAILAATYDVQGHKEQAAELRSIDKAYGAFGRSENKKYGFWKNQPACQQSASDLMKHLPGMANMQRFRFVRVGAGKQAPGAYAHNAAGLVDVRTNQLVAVLDPIVIGPLPGMQLMRRDFAQQYSPCEWAATRGLNYAPYGWGVGIDTVNEPGR